MVDSGRTPEGWNRYRLGEIIRERLELAEEWFPLTHRPEGFDKIESWTLFSRTMEQVIELGCRGDVMLTCLSRFASYNREHVVVSPGEYDADTGELIRGPKRKRQPIISPPDDAQRKSIRANLNAAIKIIEKYERLLVELGSVTPPLVEEFGDLPATLSVAYLPRLLRWSCRVLAEDSIGNFSTVQSAAQLAPCVYSELVIEKKRKFGGGLGVVAHLLNQITGTNDFNHKQLGTTLSRFKVQYGEVYHDLRGKIWALHQTSVDSPDGWKEILEASRKPRR